MWRLWQDYAILLSYLTIDLPIAECILNDFKVTISGFISNRTVSSTKSTNISWCSRIDAVTLIQNAMKHIIGVIRLKWELYCLNPLSKNFYRKTYTKSLTNPNNKSPQVLRWGGGLPVQIGSKKTKSRGQESHISVPFPHCRFSKPCVSARLNLAPCLFALEVFTPKFFLGAPFLSFFLFLLSFLRSTALGAETPTCRNFRCGIKRWGNAWCGNVAKPILTKSLTFCRRRNRIRLIRECTRKIIYDTWTDNF